MPFAVIKSGGKQYRVSPQDKVVVEKLAVAAGGKVTLDDVVMVVDGTRIKTGAALERGKAKVTASVVEHGRHPKVIVFKKKRRHNYRRKKGWRQHYTVLRIDTVPTP